MKFAKFVVALLLGASLTVGCSGGQGNPTSPSPTPTPTPNPTPVVELGSKVGEILSFILSPLPSTGVLTGGVGGNLNTPVNSGVINVNFLKLTGRVVVTLHFVQNNIIGPQIGESVEISAPGVAILPVLGLVNSVTVRNLSSVSVTGDARIYHK